MEKLETNQTETGSLKGIIGHIIALVDVERIYVHKHEKEEICHTVLTILIANTCTKSPAELLPLVNILFTEQQTLHFTLHPAHQIKDAISKGNLYFYNTCTEANLFYGKAGSDYELIPTSLNRLEMLENARKQYDSEEEKIKAFVSGADFYLEKENYVQSAFMLHQAIELNFRAIEHFITGKSKITHSIKAHQKYLEPYSIELSNIFLADTERDIKLLRLLDDAYLAVRYENSYQINKLDLSALRVKASEVKLAAFKTYQQLLTTFQKCTETFSPPQTSTDAGTEIAAQIQDVSRFEVPCSLINQIVGAFSVESIFCFGKRIFSNTRTSLFSVAEVDQTHQVHYDLLIITSAEPVNNPADLQSVINADTKSGCSVLLLAYSVESATRALRLNNRFFHKTMHQSTQIYRKQGFIQLDAMQDYDLANTSLNCDLNWKQRYFRAEAFMDAAECIWIDQDETVVLSLISQAVEQLCLGLIYAFLGYHPKQHSLHHLMDLCNNFTKEVDHIFPRQTEQDRNIFSVLNKSSSSARFILKSSIDPTDCGLLHRKARLLLEKSEQIVEQRLLTIAEG
ncbi:HEPN domain-containing protein [Dyadobacter sp. CY356]|uniref:HEPN domain-containing protein n=1 Tax=Dyadobacter sp. CY356 TaxID=2906442 RepID=UPI001F1C8F8F|nr:HEPN domain-containing protein [Dyadobacter sp. CY356]MCF0055360.1 HEPN domain-containing protein [Dyadobacter sp. CY356]